MFHVASDYGASKKTIVIAEGYATARSIAQSTDFYVVAAMSSCNLKNVVEKFSKQFRDSTIIIAADNDKAGREAVVETKQIAACDVSYPTHGRNDFNDLYVTYGADAVNACFRETFNE